MKKKLDIDTIANELRGGSAFFPNFKKDVTAPKETQTSNASLLANQQTTKPANQQTSKEANQQTNKQVNQQASLEVNQQTSKIAFSTKQKKKYGTYLRPESIMDIQVSAAIANKKDHELLQDMVDYYFEHHKRPNR
jgi:hypothetical protein